LFGFDEAKVAARPLPVSRASPKRPFSYIQILRTRRFQSSHPRSHSIGHQETVGYAQSTSAIWAIADLHGLSAAIIQNAQPNL